MAVHFQVKGPFGAGIYATYDEASDAIRAALPESHDGYFSRLDITEYEDGQQVFLNDEMKVSAVPFFEDRVAKLNRKAAKLGLPPIKVTFGAKRLKSDRDEFGTTRKYQVVMVRAVGTEVKLDGFEFFGRVDNEGGAAIVNAVPGKEIPERYRTLDNHCDHCAQNRYRKSYFIFKADAGDFLKVGSTCLKDYMGHRAASVLWVASLGYHLREASGGGDGESWGESREVRPYTNMLLALAAGVIREAGGYVSRAAANAYAEKSGGVAHLQTTGDLVSTQLQRKLPEGVKRVEIKEVDRRTATKAKAWFKAEVADKRTLSDYEHNLNALIDMPTVKAKRIGIMVSLVGVYLRKMGELAERKARDAGMVNAHVGTVGQRRVFTGEFIAQNSFEGHYGTTYFTKFATAEGLVTVSSTTNWWGDVELEKGLKLSFKATVKKHSEWKGRMETMVNRAVLEKVVAPAPAMA